MIKQEYTTPNGIFYKSFNTPIIKKVIVKVNLDGNYVQAEEHNVAITNLAELKEFARTNEAKW